MLSSCAVIHYQLWLWTFQVPRRGDGHWKLEYSREVYPWLHQSGEATLEVRNHSGMEAAAAWTNGRSFLGFVQNPARLERVVLLMAQIARVTSAEDDAMAKVRKGRIFYFEFVSGWMILERNEQMRRVRNACFFCHIELWSSSLSRKPKKGSKLHFLGEDKAPLACHNAHECLGLPTTTGFTKKDGLPGRVEWWEAAKSQNCQKSRHISLMVREVKV